MKYGDSPFLFSNRMRGRVRDKAGLDSDEEDVEYLEYSNPHMEEREKEEEKEEVTTVLRRVTKPRFSIRPIPLLSATLRETSHPTAEQNLAEGVEEGFDLDSYKPQVRMSIHPSLSIIE